MTKTSRKRRLAGSSSVQFLPISFHLSSAVSYRHAHTPKLCQTHYKLFRCSDCNCRRLAHRAKEDSLLRDMSKVCCALPCPAFHLITPFRPSRLSPSQGFSPFSTSPPLDQGIHTSLFSPSGWLLLSPPKAPTG